MKFLKALVATCVIIAGVISIFLFWKTQKQIALGIVQAPHPILHQVAEPVTEINEEVVQIGNKLLEVIQEIDSPLNIFGLGMAAPQIGYGKRVAIVKRSYGDYQIMINPEVVEQKWNVPFISTCFSLKGFHILRRSLWMKVRYTDLDNTAHEEIFRGGRATVLQQEIDHLNGILVSDL